MKKAIFLICMLGFILYGCQRPVENKSQQETGNIPQSMVEYEITNGAVTITGDTATPEDSTMLIIPDYIDGYPVTRIGEMAFYESTAHTIIVLPQTLETIDSGAFYRCYSLREIRIPANVTSIGTNPFFRAHSLKNIQVEEGNRNYCEIDGVLFSKDRKIMLVYPEGREDIHYAIPDGVTAIADDAFGYHPSVRYITIPDSLTSMPNYNIFAFPEDITIIAPENSAAGIYASKYGIARRDSLPLMQ